MQNREKIYVKHEIGDTVDLRASYSQFMRLNVKKRQIDKSRLGNKLKFLCKAEDIPKLRAKYGRFVQSIVN